MDRITTLGPGRKTPPSMWEHQAGAVGFFEPLRRAMLACDMGTGKSRMAIESVERSGAQLVLILCPKGVLGVWPRELEKYAARDWKVGILDRGTSKDKAEIVAAGVRNREIRPLVLVVNYESAWREPLGLTLLRAGFDFVVFDESQRLKSASGKASRFAFKLTHGSSKNLPIRHRLGLSGTVVHDTPLDLYGQYRALDADVLPRTYTEFKARYCVMSAYIPGKVERFVNLDDLSRRVGRITYQVSADVLKLQAPVHVERFCRLGAEGARVYRELQEELCTELEGGAVTAANAMVKALRLQQVTGGFVRNEAGQDIAVDSSKSELLREVLEDLPSGEPVVVFCRFRHDLTTVKQVALSLRRKAGEFSGETKQLDDWNAGAVSVLAVQIQAGGVGIDLTRARYCVYYSVGYSLGDYSQSLARVQRPGQTRQVCYVHLLCERTVDATVYRALRAKREISEVVLEELRASRGKAVPA